MNCGRCYAADRNIVAIFCILTLNRSDHSINASEKICEYHCVDCEEINLRKWGASVRISQNQLDKCFKVTFIYGNENHK